MSFEEQLVEKVQELYPNIEMELNEVTKNNGVKLRAIQIKNTQSTMSVQYIEDYKKNVESGKYTLEDAARFLVKAGTEIIVPEITIIKEGAFNYDMVKDKIVYSLINYEKNIELLKEIPHKRFLDLAIVYNIIIHSDKHGNMSTIVKNEFLKNWDISFKELQKQAQENTEQRYPASIRSMEDVLCNYLDDFPITGAENMMYVASNNLCYKGAGVLLYKDFLHSFAKRKGKSIYIIPSSIHELILITSDFYQGVNEIKAMIQSVNKSSVLETDVLSDNLYMLDLYSGEINIVQ